MVADVFESVFTERLGSETSRRRQMPEPTTAEPGSPLKISILAERLAAGMELHHPHDAKLSPWSPRGSQLSTLIPSDLKVRFHGPLMRRTLPD